MKKIIRSFYNILPCKIYIFWFIKHFISLPHNIYKHLHFKGEFKISVSNTKFLKMIHYGYEVENEVFWNGLENCWEKKSLEIWLKLCNTSSIIFDIGANTGIFCLTAKCQNPNSKVFAFEPVDRVFEKLKKNISINNFDINCYKIAVSNFNGKAFIYDTDTEHTYSVTVNQNLNPSGIKTIKHEITTLTIDNIIESENLNRIDLIKIDVETHEPEVLEGYLKYIKRDHPTLLIEILTNEIGARVESILRNAGCNYLYFNIDEKKGISLVDNISKSYFHNYLLCSEKTASFLNLI